jgi:hypothetical protein
MSDLDPTATSAAPEDDECPADVPGAGHDPTPNGRECRNCWAVLDA